MSGTAQVRAKGYARRYLISGLETVAVLSGGRDELVPVFAHDESNVPGA